MQKMERNYLVFVDITLFLICQRGLGRIDNSQNMQIRLEKFSIIQVINCNMRKLVFILKCIIGGKISNSHSYSIISTS